MGFPLFIETHDGKPMVSWRGICATGLVVSALSVVGFIGFRFAFDVLLGSTIDLFPGILLAAAIPTGVVLGIQLRAQRHGLRKNELTHKTTKVDAGKPDGLKERNTE